MRLETLNKTNLQPQTRHVAMAVPTSNFVTALLLSWSQDDLADAFQQHNDRHASR